MNKRMIYGLAAIAVLATAGANGAFAGEVTGNGKSLKPLHGNSVCAFSGLEDFNLAEPVEPGTVQNFGKHPNDTVGNGGVSDDPANIPNHQGRAAPGFACNPSDPQNEPS